MLSPQTEMRLETMEERALPASFGIAWPNGELLTISFAPDGTDIGGAPNQLNSSVGAAGLTSAWQREILRAFQTWVAYANVNIGLIADQGLPFGSSAPTQGSDQFGDIRVGMRGLAPQMLATSIPFQWGETWSGELVLNTPSAASIKEADLYTIALQEAGHILGLGNSLDPNSVMYDIYLGPRQGLSRLDVLGIRNLYGPRQADLMEGRGGNNTFETARRIGFLEEGDAVSSSETNLVAPTLIEGDLTTIQDVDYYRFTLPRGRTSFSIALRTGGISLLQPAITVLDGRGRVVPVEVRSGSNSGDSLLIVSQAEPEGTYTIKVEAATRDVFGIGAYRLAVGNDVVSAVFSTTQDASLWEDERNDTLGGAIRLRRHSPFMDGSIDAQVQGAISSSNDVDFYAISAPADRRRGPKSLLVTVWGEQDGFRPVLEVFDRFGNRLPTQVRFDRNGAFGVAVNGIREYDRYYIRVAGSGTNWTSRTGRYSLTADFRPEQAEANTLKTGTLSADRTQDFSTLTILENQLFTFQLADANLLLGPKVRLQMSIFDSRNQQIFTLVSSNGEPVCDTVWLDVGTYTIRVRGAALDGSLLPEMQYRLDGQGKSESVGLEPVENILAPLPGTNPPPPPPSDPPPTDTVTSFIFTVYSDDYYAAVSSALLPIADPFGPLWWN